MLEFVVILVGFYVAWNIGCNDSANAIGTSVGSGATSHRMGILVVAISAIIGTSLAGKHVSSTVVEASSFCTTEMMIIALACAGAWVTTASYFGLPVSTTQSTIGAIAGTGLAISSNISWDLFIDMVMAWISNPFITAVVAYSLCYGFTIIFRPVRDIVMINRIFSALTILIGAFMAFMIGSNGGGTVAGAIFAITSRNFSLLALCAGLGIAIGAISFSGRVVRSVGKKITELSPLAAFSSQFGAALVILMFNHLFPSFGFPSLPVSSSQAIVGGVMGAGLVKGMYAINKRRMIYMITGWVLTPMVACALAFFSSILLI